MQNYIQERNVSLDYLRLILSVLVISIHIEAPFNSSPLISWPLQDGLARIAVPVFFIMNGFFMCPILEDKTKIKKYLFRIVLLYVVWTVIYRPLHGDTNFSGSSSHLIDTLYVYIFGYVHLWYMAALIPIVIILYYFKKWNFLNNYLLVVLLVLYVIGFLYQRPYLLGMEPRPSEEYAYMRNFLTPGLLYVFIGYYINDRKIVDKIKTGPKAIVTLIVLCIILMGESLITLQYGTPSDYYLALPVLCPLLFIIVYQNGKMGTNGKYIRDLATAVYFSHILVGTLLVKLDMFRFSALYLMVVFFTLILSAALVELNKRINIFL